MRDIVVTWPKNRALDDYLATLAWAERNGREINYRVPRLPTWDDALPDHGVTGWAFGVEHPRCYRVHDGAVRGWTEILYCTYREYGDVWYASGEDCWPEGLYIVCSPEWNRIDPVPMAGFRGWRWFEEAERRSLLAEQRGELLT